MENELNNIIINEPNYVRIKKNITHTSHAHLIVSPDPLFSNLFCKQIIKEILYQNNLNHVAEKVENGTYIDLQEITSDSTIKVSDISPIIEKSNETGIESDFKFYIISNAQLLTTEAQNKLLKTLEEPHENQYYFLCTPSRFLLLPTIASRCNVVELAESNKSCIENYLLKKGLERIAANDSAQLSLGSYSKADSKTNQESFSLALNALTQITSSAQAAKFAVQFQKSNLEQVAEYLEFILLDAIKLKYDVRKIWFEGYQEKILKLKPCSINGLLLIYNQLQKIKELLKVNVSQVVLADRIALSIAEGKNKK